MPLDLSKIRGVELQTPRQVAAHPTFLFYGMAKTGKTTLAASASVVPEMGPVLAVDFEGSLESVAGQYDSIDVVRCVNWGQTSQTLDALIQQDHGYKTVILDPVNALQKQLQDEIVRQQKIKNLSNTSNNSLGDRVVTQADWGVVGTRMRRILEAFHATTKFTAIFIAHADRDKEETGAISVEPMMQGKISKVELGRIPTVIGYTSMTYIGGNVAAKVRFAPGNGLIAGDRTRKLPAEMDDPTMAEIWKLLQEDNETVSTDQ